MSVLDNKFASLVFYLLDRDTCFVHYIYGIFQNSSCWENNSQHLSSPSHLSRLISELSENRRTFLLARSIQKETLRFLASLIELFLDLTQLNSISIPVCVIERVSGKTESAERPPDHTRAFSGMVFVLEKDAITSRSRANPIACPIMS